MVGEEAVETSFCGPVYSGTLPRNRPGFRSSLIEDGVDRAAEQDDDTGDVQPRDEQEDGTDMPRLFPVGNQYMF